jgi:hypothetical protein
MNQPSDEFNCSELKAEVEALRKKMEAFEARSEDHRAISSARKRWFSKARGLWLLLLVCLLAAALMAAVGDNALFINPQGYVGINTTKPEAPLDVNGNARLGGDARVGGAIEAGNSDLYFTNPNHEHTGKGNTQGYAAIENAKGYNALMILGRTSSDPGSPRYIGMWDKVGIGMSGNDKPRAALDVRGDVIANNLVADNTWVKLIDQGFASDQDYTMKADGQTYRRFRIEMEGTLLVRGRDKHIGLRPNNATGPYGPGARHWQGHEPNVTWHHGVGDIGNANMLPLCTTHWNQDGYVMCTGEMNTRTGIARMIITSDIFNTSGRCGGNGDYPSCVMSDIAVNAWRDTTTPITSLTLTFNGGVFYGRMILYGKK